MVPPSLKPSLAASILRASYPSPGPSKLKTLRATRISETPLRLYTVRDSTSDTVGLMLQVGQEANSHSVLVAVTPLSGSGSYIPI